MYKRQGLVVGVAYGLLQMIQDPWIVTPVQAILDYPLAFACIALAAVARKLPDSWGWLAGMALAAVGRQRMRDVTDDCSIFELAGLPVRLVEGEYANRKITTREDLPAHAKEETAMRVGHGYDVHRLVEGRKLILGGVDIPHHLGLLGHSDADVVTHALMDALLGAAALGDIGQHFPDTDPAYRDISSLDLLGRVMALLAAQGWRVENVDLTILAQRPKLKDYLPQMRQNYSRAMGLPVTAISVKATTEEGLGFTGTEQGIAAHGVVLLEPLGK